MSDFDIDTGAHGEDSGEARYAVGWVGLRVLGKFCARLSPEEAEDLAARLVAAAGEARAKRDEYATWLAGLK